MADSDLASYQLQLQQVEAALLADPESGELQKLKEDLLQVIDLTKELVQASAESEVPQQTEATSSSTERSSSPNKHDDGGASSSSSHNQGQHQQQQQPIKHWQVGEQCRALWGTDGNYHEATITEIYSSDNTAKVTFTGRWSNQSVVSSLASLRLSEMGYTGSATAEDKKAKLVAQREYLKKKKAKKAERYKEMEQKTEAAKSSWQNFSTKGSGKKGFVKKSIFKTPENSSGRVGVGTCGTGGQKMTDFKMTGNKFRRN